MAERGGHGMPCPYTAEVGKRAICELRLGDAAEVDEPADAVDGVAVGWRAEQREFVFRELTQFDGFDALDACTNGRLRHWLEVVPVFEDVEGIADMNRSAIRPEGGRLLTM